MILQCLEYRRSHFSSSVQGSDTGISKLHLLSASVLLFCTIFNIGYKSIATIAFTFDDLKLPFQWT